MPMKPKEMVRLLLKNGFIEIKGSGGYIVNFKILLLRKLLWFHFTAKIWEKV